MSFLYLHLSKFYLIIGLNWGCFLYIQYCVGFFYISEYIIGDICIPINIFFLLKIPNRKP